MAAMSEINWDLGHVKSGLLVKHVNLVKTEALVKVVKPLGRRGKNSYLKNSCYKKNKIFIFY